MPWEQMLFMLLGGVYMVVLLYCLTYVISMAWFSARASFINSIIDQLHTKVEGQHGTRTSEEVPVHTEGPRLH